MGPCISQEKKSLRNLLTRIDIAMGKIIHRSVTDKKMYHQQQAKLVAPR